MRFRGLPAIVAALFLLGSGFSDGAGADEQRAVAEIPELGDCDRFLRPCGESVLLGSHELFNGRLEISAFSSRIGLCVWLDHVGQGGVVGCGRPAPPSEDGAIEVGFWSYARGSKGPYTDISGTLRGDVASVTVRYRRHGNVRHRQAWVTELTGEVQDKLKLDAPAGHFARTIRGCVRPKRLRAAAFDGDGQPLGRAAGPFFGFTQGSCR